MHNMEWQRKYRWTLTWGNETHLNGAPYEDYIGWDGDLKIGRIFLDLQAHGPERWRWAVVCPKGIAQPDHSEGCSKSSGEALSIVETAWDKLKEQMQS